MTAATTLTTVEFNGDLIWAADMDGTVYVAIKPICERLGLAWNAQLERLKRDSVLSEGMRVIRIPSPGGVQETVVLPLDLLNGWLFGIDESRVKDEATRQRVLIYKRACYRVLFEHFFGVERPAEDEIGPAPRAILPGHPDFPQAVRLVREARLSRGTDAAMAVWRAIGLPWVPELEGVTMMVTPSSAPGEDDAVARFALEGIERAPGVTTPAAMLWPAFVQFCAVHGLANTGEKSFFTRFGRMGFSKRKVAGRMVYLNMRPRLAIVAGAGGDGA